MDSTSCVHRVSDFRLVLPLYGLCFNTVFASVDGNIPPSFIVEFTRSICNDDACVCSPARADCYSIRM